MYPDQNFTPYTPPQPPKPTYTPADHTYAWLSLLFAFLFCQAVPVIDYPFGGFLLILALFISGFVILRIKKLKLSPVCVLSALSSLVIGSALLLTNTEFLMKLSYTYCLASYLYFLYAAFGNRIEQGFSDYIYIDFIKILFIMPFTSLGAIFPALSGKSTKKGSRFLLKVLVGIGIAFIPTLLVSVFLSYDSGFQKLMDDIFSFELDFGHTFLSLMFTLPLAMYGFGLYAASQKKTLQGKMTAQSCENGLQKVKILPQLTAAVAVLPILFLYVVFFISQWKYYVSGFTGVLPADFSYAEYARQGFFELCSVSVINLIMIVSIAFFIKRGKHNHSVMLMIVATVFCLCTLILISTAVAKLVMYINYYGLTQKRIYAMWLMALIAIVFLLIALGQFLRKFKTVAVCLCVAIVMFGALAVCNVNALCARYNTDRYLSGSLETIDLEAMEELGDAAIPSLVRVVTSMDAEKDPQLKQNIDVILYEKAEQFRNEDVSLFSFSLPSALAKSALRDYVPNVPPAGSYVISEVEVNGRYVYRNSNKPENNVIIHPDRTGTITFEDKTASFRISDDTFIVDDITFQISCNWTAEYELLSVRLSWDGDEDSYEIRLEPAK